MPRTKKNKKITEPLSRPRGTRDLIGESFYKYEGFFERSAEIALYYGFKPIHTPLLENELVFTSGVGTNTDIVEKEMYSLKTKGGASLAMRPEGTAGIMRSYIENGMHADPQPVMFYYYGPFFRHNKPQLGRFREFFQFGIEVIGTSKSIADATIIQVTNTILSEAGVKNLCVLINSIGDDECRPDYIKELVAYYRKNLSRLCPHCKQRIKTNPLRLLDCKNEQCAPIKENAPEAITFLCDGCKTHFKEVLEYLDTMKIPYKIDHSLVRGIDYYTRTVFEIIADTENCSDDNDNKDGPPDNAEKKPTPAPLALASGGRYDNLARQLGSKQDISAVGAAIGVDRVLFAPGVRSTTPRIIKKSKIYFIQLGFEAKLKSLAIIEILRKAKIPVTHSLSKDKLSIQLAIAEKSNIPYVLIMGKKEAFENSVIVRNMNVRSQDTVMIDKLAEYLKKKI